VSTSLETGPVQALRAPQRRLPADRRTRVMDGRNDRVRWHKVALARCSRRRRRRERRR
jgi:hypothetical protein